MSASIIYKCGMQSQCFRLCASAGKSCRSSLCRATTFRLCCRSGLPFAHVRRRYGRPFCMPLCSRRICRAGRLMSLRQPLAPRACKHPLRFGRRLRSGSCSGWGCRADFRLTEVAQGIFPGCPAGCASGRHADRQMLLSMLTCNFLRKNIYLRPTKLFLFTIPTEKPIPVKSVHYH